MKVTVVDTDRCIGCQLCMLACARRFGEAGFTRSSIGVRSIGGMERGFKVILCRACKNPSCAKACPKAALRPKRGGGVVFDAKLCDGCRLCDPACMVKAVFFDESKKIPQICTHCGYCVSYCPHGVLKKTVLEVDPHA